jgi:DNA-binding NtrC family response regulator
LPLSPHGKPVDTFAAAADLQKELKRAKSFADNPIQRLAAHEKEMIEAALRDSGGRVSGPSGAAARLGIHRSTLESKIASLKINKYRFKTARASKNN